jgi:hypothetical protein
VRALRCGRARRVSRWHWVTSDGRGGHRRCLLFDPQAVVQGRTSFVQEARLWDELYPAEQARIMRLLIERIDVAPDGISVTLHAAGIRSLVAELADQATPALLASEPVLEVAE